MDSRVFPLLLAAALACDAGKVEDIVPDPQTPVGRTAGFLRAVRANDCERAWHYFSRETQAAARFNGEEQVLQHPYAVDDFAPLRFYCVKYRGIDAESVKLISQEDRHAQVEGFALEATNFRIPGFSPREHRLVPRTIDLVHEEGEWRLAYAVPPEPARGWTEVERDGVRIRTAGAGHPQQLRVVADVRASVADVEQAAMDWQHWPDWVPELNAVAQVGTVAEESNPILRTTAAHPMLSIHLAGEPPLVADYLLYRYVSTNRGRNIGFSTALRPQGDSDDPSADHPPFRFPAVEFVVYPDLGGSARIQLGLTNPMRGGAPLRGAPPGLPSPELVVRFVQALERYAASRH